jgi:putative MFS transporter
MTELTSAPTRERRMTFTVFVALLGAFLDGYDLVIISGALLFIKAEFQLSSATVGWVGSIVFAGMVVGALSFGRLTDRVGRSAAFVFVLALFVAGSLLSALAVAPWMLILGRLVVGLGIGADLPVSTTLIAEAVPASRRGTATGLMQVFWFAGAAVSGLVGVLLFTVLGPDSWRWMLGSAVLLALVVMALRRRVPESAQWKAAHDRAPAGEANGSLRVLGAPGIRAALLFSCLFWFLVTIRGAGYNLYTPTFLRQVGATGPTTALWLGMSVNVLNTAVALVAVRYLDRIGRRTIILICWSVTTALTLCLAALSGGHPFAMFVMITLSALPQQLLAMALFPLSVEAFPTLVRGTARAFGKVVRLRAGHRGAVDPRAW